MASADNIKSAIGCLSTVYPQFVAKELSVLTDSIVAAVQGFTDPLAAIGDLNIDSIIDGVSQISEGDAFGNLEKAAAGLTSQYVRREAQGIVDAQLSTGTAAKRIQQVQVFSEGLVNAGITMMAIFPDLPYAAAQKMCRTIIRLNELKTANLSCLRKHIVQLVNSVIVLVENRETFKDDTLEDLTNAKTQIDLANTELVKSQPVSNGITGFDQNAFDRAREALLLASRYLTPDLNGTSIFDVTDILTSGSVNAAHVTRENASLVHLAIPSLTSLIEVEISAIVSQIEVINFYVNQLTSLIDSYRDAGSSSRVKAQRSRAIFEIRDRLVAMSSAMELSISRGSITSASGQMLIWSSRVKAILSKMVDLGQLSLEEGSIEGEDKAFALNEAFKTLLTDLTGINVSVQIGSQSVALVANGIEDPIDFRDKVLSLVKMTRRILSDLENGTVSQSRIATLHGLAAQVAGEQVAIVDGSASSASQQTLACTTFADIDLQVSENYETLLDSMRQVGLDRAVDLLGSGQFTTFLDSGLDELSYLGAAVNCLTDALNGIDDIQTRQSIIGIRDEMVGKRSNVELAAADSADQGRTRFIDKAKEEIASIQQSAKTVEAIVTDLKTILENIGGSLSETFGQFTDFLGNVDHLAVGAGGRLADTLEEFSDHPNAGVVKCDAV